MNKGFGLGHPLRMPKYYTDQNLKRRWPRDEKLKINF